MSADHQKGQRLIFTSVKTQVVNGGSGKPSPTVAFPGVYTGNEPGILISAFIRNVPPARLTAQSSDIYDLPAGYTGYQARELLSQVCFIRIIHSNRMKAGPAVWTG